MLMLNQLLWTVFSVGTKWSRLFISKCSFEPLVSPVVLCEINDV